MVTLCISNIQHFNFQLTHTTLKNAELLEHFKISKTAPTCCMLSFGWFPGIWNLYAYKFQTPGNHPKESIQHSVHGKSLKSRLLQYVSVYKETMVSLMFFWPHIIV